MNINRSTLVLTGVLVFLVGLPFLILFIVLGPLHEFNALRNTRYSSQFTDERFNQVVVGMPRSAVVGLLGEPFSISTLTNYPVWALNDDGVRQHYGTNAQLMIEALSFSIEKNKGDYEEVEVWIGPDDRVVERNRWVTD